MTDPSEFLNLISTGGSGGSFLDDIGINMPSTSIPQGSASEQFFNMDTYPNFNNRPPGGGTPHQKLHHLDGQSQGEAFQPFSQKLSHYANPMVNQQSAFQGSAPSKPQPQQFPRMPIRMHSPNQFNAQPSNSPGSPWRGQPEVNSIIISNYLPPQSQQQSPEQGMPARSIPQSYPTSMSQQQSNIQRLQHFMTNKQTNPMLGQSQNPFLSQAGSTLTDISNSTPKMNRDNKPALLSPNVQQQYATDMARQEQFSKLHHLSAGSVPSPSSDTSTNTATSLPGFSASTNSTFTPSPDPFSSGKNPVAMFTNMQQQQQHSGLPNQSSIQSPDPFVQSTPAVAMPQDFLMRRQPQFSEGVGFPMRPAVPYPQQMMNPSPNQVSGQLKSAHLLYQLQRLQQQISQVRELPSSNDQQLNQLQQQFGRLYHLYLMDQQRQKKQFQTGQLTYDQVGILKQQQQEKANRIVAEAIAKSALTNNSFNFRMEAPMKYFNQQYGVGPAVKAPMNYDMKQLDKIVQRKAMEPIILPPSIVNQLPKTVVMGSSK